MEFLSNYMKDDTYRHMLNDLTQKVFGFLVRSCVSNDHRCCRQIYCYISVLVLVTQPCPTLGDPMDYSLPGSCPWILQAKTLEWVALLFSRGPS